MCVIGSWIVMADVAKCMYTITSRGKSLNPVPGEAESLAANPECVAGQVHDLVHKCHSALLTWHSDVGLDNHKMQAHLASACDVESIEHLMHQLPCYAAGFKLFCDHVQKLVSVSGAKCYACCMEHCRHGEKPGRVHLHAYMGAAASFVRDSGITPPFLEIPLRMLNFHGYHAHARLSRLKGHSQAKQANNDACQGVYYIMAPKLGQLFSCSSHLPFEDRSCKNFSISCLLIQHFWVSFAFPQCLCRNVMSRQGLFLICSFTLCP
jgi:hypothetical protein